MIHTTKQLGLSIAILGLLSVVFLDISLAQEYTPSDERSSFDQRKVSVMDGNRLRASYHNTGHAGRRSSDNLSELIFEFPKNTNREYIYFISTMFGTEVPDMSTPEDDEFPIVSVASYKSSRDGRTNWSLNPIKGYARDDSDEIARSDRGPTSPLGNTWPNTWPDKLNDGGDGWPNSWNGFFGRDQFNADVEFYYKAGDDTYTRYNGTRFAPDQTDPSRGGLGIIMDTRILAWSQTLVNATHFNIFEIKNDGSYDYPRMAFGLWIADFVAGGGPLDTPEFDNIRSIAYITDQDRQSGGNVFDGGLIGQMGLKFLETPGNAIDGIDNDADSDYYNQTNTELFNDENADLYQDLTTAQGGYYSYSALIDSVIPQFNESNFEERVIQPGDKIVRILDDYSRVIDVYNGSTIESQGRIWEFDGPITITEDVLSPEDPGFGNHIDGLDNDFDGLIDENRPNHLLKSTFITASNTFEPRPVRYINYLHFQPGDTLGRGLIVPNATISAPSSDELRSSINPRQGYHTSAPMIDEGREDGFDNDKDWTERLDDVGIEGDPDRESAGKGDGRPSSGAGTSFPGEPNIDKTDVSETDLIGITRVRIFDAGALQVVQDADIWLNYLIPGEFEEKQGTDSDIFVSSGLFPLLQGTSERFALAITAAQENGTPQQDRNRVNLRLEDATRAYESDYQFAVAPNPPILQAVAGDGKVTLYWDDSAESSFDRYINIQTGDGNDFEGYKIYRTTDVSFEEILSITDGFGSGTYLSPLAIYDIQNGISGFHPVADNGLQFNLGNDSGLKRIFEDTDVINGRTYYYAVTSYDRGFEEAGISPSESPVQISLNPDGTVILGQNVVKIRPSKDRAGYISPDNPNAELVSGSPGGTVDVQIVDPSAVRPDAVYDVVFEDTLVKIDGAPDEIRTQNFSMREVGSGTPKVLIDRSRDLNGQFSKVIDGFTISVTNEEGSGIDDSRTTWSSSQPGTPHDYEVVTQGPPVVRDYELIVGDGVGFGTSIAATVETFPGNFRDLPSIATNFVVRDRQTGESISYAFQDLNNPSTPQQRCNPTFFPPANYQQVVPGQLSAVAGFSGRCSDVIYLIEDYRGQEDIVTYRISMNAFFSEGGLLTRHPVSGDTLSIFTKKPFIEGNRFQFVMDGDNLPQIDIDTLQSDLDEVLVIPNPYKVSSVFEPQVTSTNFQQNRELHFVGVPAPSTLRIFTASGTLIRKIDITESSLTSQYGGTYIWNMLTKDNLEISYGVYLYHISTPEGAEKTGKFAVIK